jgi:hypothetical protein
MELVYCYLFNNTEEYRVSIFRLLKIYFQESVYFKHEILCVCVCLSILFCSVNSYLACF